ncbi:hypothetical protein IFM89_001298 [Coptis chinensis]|uniref:GTP-binding protein n=1 Tax=Coptis chinensis TaxID=261450 RepID=A0A835M8A5_9MAGN|nr:hypothetical protein IFM89_001298 [Coptis chinensis]
MLEESSLPPAVDSTPKESASSFASRSTSKSNPIDLKRESVKIDSGKTHLEPNASLEKERNEHSSPESSMVGDSTRDEGYGALPELSSAPTELSSFSCSVIFYIILLRRISFRISSSTSAKLARIRAAALSDCTTEIVVLRGEGVNPSSILQRICEGYHTARSIESNDNIMGLELKSSDVLDFSDFYSESLSIWFVYDITNKSSFNFIENCIQEIESCARDSVIKILVANKPDRFLGFLRKRAVLAFQGKLLASLHDMIFFETDGSKTNMEVEDILSNMIAQINQMLLKAETEIQTSAPRTDDVYYLHLVQLGNIPGWVRIPFVHAFQVPWVIQQNSSNKKIMGVMLVYDITNGPSFQKLKSNWINWARDPWRDNVSIILVGNKVDVDGTKRVVPTSAGQVPADKYGVQFFETSAVTNYNVEQAFLSLARDPIEVLEYSRLLYKNAFGNKKSLRRSM